MTLTLPIDPQANELLNRNPLALLIAMLLDQQVPMERAFAAPHGLAERLGREPDAAELAACELRTLEEHFARRPALHRYPKAMARRVQALCREIAERYGGDAGRIWADAATGEELRRRVAALPGFGEQKAQIFVALLGKRLGVRPEGWREAAGAYGEEGSHRSVADVVDEESLIKVRDYKRRLKAAARTAGTG